MNIYKAKEGCVFDWRVPHYIGEDENGNLIKARLYVKTLYLDKDDSIENYIEVPIDTITDKVIEEV